MNKLKRLFTPGKIGNVEIANRLVVTSMVANYCGEDGVASDLLIDYFEAKAKGGYGLIMSEALIVAPVGKGFAGEAGIWEDGQIPGLKKLTERIHKYDSKIFAQIIHAGRQTLRETNGGYQPLAPSPIPCPVRKEMPKEMTIEEIKETIAQFGDAALRAKKAGFDGVEIHAGHGYLVAEFISNYSNKRVDEYGGSLINRMRFLMEIITDVRSKVGKDFSVGVRISADESMPGGRNIEDTKAIARILEADCGIDYINVSSGTYGDGGTTPPMHVGHGWKVNNAAEVKKVVSIPVITVARINDPLIAETVLMSGKADFVAMTRASLADPDMPNKAKAGEFDRIRQCIGCMQGCYDNLQIGKPIRCLVNPTIGYESTDNLSPASASKKVVVIGGGPAGIEAARASALKGHRVELYEKESNLGGQFTLASYSPGKGEFASYIAWADKELKTLGVTMHFNSEINVEKVKKLSPDVVVVATGGKPFLPPIPGIEGPNVVIAKEVLRGTVETGVDVIVAGGGMVGAETAAHLGIQGKKVTIIEMLPAIAIEESPAVRGYLMELLRKYGVQMITNTCIKNINGKGVTASTDGVEKEYAADTVVAAFGYRSDNSMVEELKQNGLNVVEVGDVVKVRKALDAVREGYEAGLNIS